MVEPIPSPISLTCPMCGKAVSTGERRCSACGEALTVDSRSDVVDRIVACITGSIGLMICGFLLINLEPALKVIGAVVTFGWFWGPPLIGVALYQSQPIKVRKISPWRIFWRIQAIMFALTFSFMMLCIAVCTPPMGH